MEILIKIFLPKHFYKLKKNIGLYGDIVKEDNVYIIYILDVNDSKIEYLNSIGTVIDENEIEEKQINKTHKHVNNEINSVKFMYNQNDSNLLLESIVINSISFNTKNKVHLILYDYKCFEFLSQNDCHLLEDNVDNEIITLAKLIKDNYEIEKKETFYVKYICAIVLFICTLLSKILKLFNFFVKESAVTDHFADWLKCVELYIFCRRKVWTIIIDTIAGTTILYLIWYYGNPYDYLMRFTMYIVENLRRLLDGLKGNPAGLKLNSQLNKFLLECFKYHIELWATFLMAISPAIQYLFVPLGILGILGLSFQLAMLSDLLLLITLHAHCFYIYAALLYHIEIVGLKALWRVMLGRRYNVLKNRVESYDYENGQLYLATMFFAGLLFLLPTIFVYYAVFASLRFLVYCITYTLMKLRKHILTFPVYSYFQWILKNYVTADNIELKIMKSENIKVHSFTSSLLVLAIRPKSAVPWNNPSICKIPNDDPEKHLLSISGFYKRLVRGDLIGFITPVKKKLNNF